MLSTTIVSKVITYTATVKYTTFNTLLDPCAFLQSTLAEDVVKDLGLSAVYLLSCALVSVSVVSNQNLYTFSVVILI
jgi:hypothetical protein